jgi:hypothetical protein
MAGFNDGFCDHGNEMPDLLATGILLNEQLSPPETFCFIHFVISITSKIKFEN